MRYGKRSAADVTSYFCRRGRAHFASDFRFWKSNYVVMSVKLSLCGAASDSYLVLIWLAGFTDEVLVLGNLLWLQAQTEEMVPEFAAVALNPINLKYRIQDN